VGNGWGRVDVARVVRCGGGGSGWARREGRGLVWHGSSGMGRAGTAGFVGGDRGWAEWGSQVRSGRAGAG
jgi:hypothetical protein